MHRTTGGDGRVDEVLQVVHPDAQVGEAERSIGRCSRSPPASGAIQWSSSTRTSSLASIRDRKLIGASFSMVAATSSPMSMVKTSSKPSTST